VPQACCMRAAEPCTVVGLQYVIQGEDITNQAEMK
jgi:hypothetical protein